MRAFDFFCGVPKLLVPDHEMAMQYGVGVVPA
jgi:hypothetical protein